ncbi:MAG: LexA family transcriptional regulator [Planctomycetia bacterium]|nr:LexA family transcriptional regulator [Planctomycetia bacterium]
MAPTDGGKSTCDRLRALREEVFGARGRATFARAMGISPSTYIYYEKGRVPPSNILVAASQATGARLEWLLTGEGPRFKSAEEMAAKRSEAGAAGDDMRALLLERFREATAGGAHGDAAARALVGVLDEIGLAFPADAPRAWERRHVESADGLIPILGRSAAGLVASWGDCFGTASGEAGPALADLARALETDVHARGAKDVSKAELAAPVELPARGGEARLVQLSEPLESGLLEFIECPPIRSAYPRAFGVRVDGDSMSPRFKQGDILIVGPDAPLRQGQAAVVQIKGKIGATVKLYRRDGDAVHLVPINGNYEVMTLPADRIEWALPVLYCVRM